jgi:hypothetical protein
MTRRCCQWRRSGSTGVKINNIGLGKSIYTKEQLEEFARFQDSQGTRKAYLAETAEMAYTGRNEKGEWGLAVGSAAQGSLIDLVGVNQELQHRRSAKEVFVVAKQPREGGVNRPPPEFRCRGRGQCKLEARKGHKGVDVEVTTSRGECSGLYEVGVVMSS